MCVQNVCPPMPVLMETSPAIFFHHFPRSFLDMEFPRESGASLPFRFDRLGSEPRDTPTCPDTLFQLNHRGLPPHLALQTCWGSYLLSPHLHSKLFTLACLQGAR